MKIWGIIAIILLVVAIGFGGWLYIQNKNLKNDKSKLETNLSTVQSSHNKKISNASKKMEVLSIFFSGINDQESMFKAYELIKEMNDPTLSADWSAMQNSKPGDSSGDKMVQDLISAAAADLK